MNIFKIVGNNAWKQITYLIEHENTAILIDCGASLEQIQEVLAKKDSSLKAPEIKAIFLTHSHFDHILYLEEIQKKFNCPIYIKSGCENYLHSKEYNCSTYFTRPITYKPSNIIPIKDEEPIILAPFTITPLFTPGHSKCSVSYLIDNNIFTGDTLFGFQTGRTDLIGGDDKELEMSVEKILSQDFKLAYPGHGIPFTRR